jgi:hypothetical protein
MLRIFFGPHSLDTFTLQFDQLLEWGDVLAMEYAYANGETEVGQYWTDVAQGRTIFTESGLPGEEFRDCFLGRLSELSLTKSRVVVIERSPIKKIDEENLVGLYNESRESWSKVDVSLAVLKLRAHDQQFAEHQKQRDISYAQQLKGIVATYSDKSVLCYRGALHYETLRPLLIKENVKFESYLFCSPYLPPFGEEITKMFIDGRHVNDEIMMRRHIEQDLLFNRLKLQAYSYKRALEVRNEVTAMSRREIDTYISRLKGN